MMLDRKKFGFWYNLLDLNLRQLSGVEGIAAIVLGVGGGVVLCGVTTQQERVAATGDFLPLVGALLGIVFAAFALVVAFLSDHYMLLLQKNPKGTRAFFAPFMINIGMEVAVLIGVVVYRVSAAHLSHMLEKIYFVVLGTLFVYVLLNVVGLARNVMAHAVTRAELAEIEELQREVDRMGHARRRRPEG